MCFVTGLLMAPGLGNVAVGDGSSTLPIGDQPVGDRIGAACTLPSTPTIDFNPDAEAYADSDVACTWTDQGSNGVNMVQETSTACWTYSASCTGMTDHACFENDNGDHQQENAATIGTFSQNNLICMVFRMDTLTQKHSYYDGVTAREYMFSDTTTGQVRFFSGTTLPTGENISAGSWGYTCFTFADGASNGSVNGVEVSGPTGSQALAGLTIGDNASLADGYDGAMARFLMWDTPPDRAAAEAYIECEYGL